MTEETRGTFTITIKRQGNEYTIEADASNGIRVAAKRLRPLETWLSDEHRQTIGWFKAQKGPLDFSERLMALGTRLYEVLFHRSGLGVAFGRAVGNEGGIRLCLQVEPPELAALPWEIMYDASMSGGLPWLATRTNMPLLRRLPPASSGAIPNKLNLQGPLRILFVAASPDGLPKLSIAKLAKALQEQLRDAIEADQIVLDIVLNATLEALRDKLLPDEHHILFFAGHGEANQLCFDDGQGDDGQAGDPYWLTAEDVARELAGKTSLRLLFLAACHVPSTQTPATDTQKPLAHQLWDLSTLPALVAMQSFISDKQANALSLAFFRAIAEGQAVDMALNHARKALIYRDSQVGRDVFTPVLFWRAAEERLFERIMPKDQPATLPPAPGESPYKGLRSFEEEDADQFFGRERLTAELLDLLLKQRFLAVVGASGSGKSSLLRAGIVPGFKRGQAKDPEVPLNTVQDDDYWLVRVITPTKQPLETLATSLTEDVESPIAAKILKEDLAKDQDSLHFYARKLLSRTGSKRLLLVVDQFEELFTLCRDKKEQKAFVNNLLTATSAATDGPTLVVMALRADFYAHCSQFDGLREALEQQQKYIGPMNEVELRQSIEKPAENGNWRFESGLVELLLKDVGHEPGALPLLSHALHATWQRRSARRLTFAGYHDSGGVKGAIAQSADHLYQQLSPEEQAVTRSIFLQLTELGDNTPDTRRRVPLSELTERTHSANKPLVERVINILADARLLTVFKASIEVAHEALIREWPHLREWLGEDREGMRIQRRLSEAAQTWEDLNRDKGALYRGLMLSQALEWAKTHYRQLNQKERLFLKKSKKWVKQERAEREARLQRELKQEQALRKADQERVKAAEAQQQAERERAEEAEARRKAEEQRAEEAEARQQAERERAEEAERREQEQAKASYQFRGLATVLFIILTFVLIFALPTYYEERGNEELNDIIEAIKILEVTKNVFFKHPQQSLLLITEALHTINSKRPNLIDIRSNLIEFLPKVQGVSLSGHEQEIKNITFSLDGNWLVTTDGDSPEINSMALLWNISNEIEHLNHKSLNTNNEIMDLVSFSNDNRWLITVSRKKEPSQQGSILKLWNLNETDLSLNECKFNNVITNILISSDNKKLIATSMDLVSKHSTLHIRNLSNLCDTKQTQLAFKSRIDMMEMSPNNELLVVVSESQDVYVLKFNSAMQITEPLISNDLDSIETIRFSPDSRFLILSYYDKELKILNFNENKINDIPMERNRSIPLRISHDSRWLITVASDTTIRLWDLQSNDFTEIIIPGEDKDKLLEHRNQFTEVTAVNISSDSRWLVAGASNGKVYLWDLKNLSNDPISLFSDNEYITALHVSSNCKTDQLNKPWIVAGDEEGNIYLWECNTIMDQTRQEPINLTGHDESILDVRVTPRNYLISSSVDGTVRLLDLEKKSNQKNLLINLTIEELVNLTCQKSGRNLTQMEWEQYFYGQPYRKTCDNLPVHYTVKEQLLVSSWIIRLVSLVGVMGVMAILFYRSALSDMRTWPILTISWWDTPSER